MKSGWQKYLLYASIVLVGGFIIFETVRLKNTGFEGKALWDWMELLIIPLFLAGGAIGIGWWERKTEREIATDRQQETALQAYLDRMAELLLKEELRTTERAEVRDVARTRTLSVMRGLDTRRKNLVIHFLREANLLNSPNSILRGANMEEMNLQDMDFSKVSLYDVNLKKANLKGADMEEARLQDAKLWEANLQDVYLWNASLKGANLWKAQLQRANLCNADLERAILVNANLQGALLVEADLEGADLESADLKGVKFLYANLKDANLKDAKITNAELAKATSLKGATMPDGTKHE